MTFTEIKPQGVRFGAGYLWDKVRVSFPIINHTQQMVLIIGKEIAKSYGFNKGDRVVLLVNDQNPFIWQLKKDPLGYKLGVHSKHLKLQIAWGKREIPQGWTGTHFVDKEQVDGNMQLSIVCKKSM